MAEKVTQQDGAAAEAASRNSLPGKASDLNPELDFEIFGPDPETRTMKSGLKVTVRPFNVYQTRHMIPHLKNLMGPLGQMLGSGEFDITKLQEIDGQALCEATAIALSAEPGDVTADDVDHKMELSEFVWAVTKIVTVNGSFFVRVLPKLLGGAAIAVVKLAESMGGLSSFKSSSEPVIPSKTSTDTP